MILSDEELIEARRHWHGEAHAALFDTIDHLRQQLADLEGIDKVADFGNETIGKMQADIDRLEAELSTARAETAAVVQLAAGVVLQSNREHGAVLHTQILALASVPARLALEQRDAETRLTQAEWWQETGCDCETIGRSRIIELTVKLREVQAEIGKLSRGSEG